MSTDNFEVVAQAVLDHLKARATTVGIDTKNMYYGDQTLIPTTPALCVETGPMRAQLVGSAPRTDNTFVVYVIVYHGKVQGAQLTRKECDQKAYTIKKVLEENKSLGGVIFGYVTSVEPGFAVTGQATLLRANRITWEGSDRVQI